MVAMEMGINGLIQYLQYKDFFFAIIEIGNSEQMQHVTSLFLQ